MELDNEQKRRALQLEVDRELESSVVSELDLPKGEPDSAGRRKLIEVIRIAFELPADFESEVEDTADGEMGDAGHG